MSIPLPLLTIFPPEIKFVFPDDIGEFTCRLAWRRSRDGGTSRYCFRWPAPGEWTETVKADRSDEECSFGLHAAKNWRGALGGRPLFQLVAVPVGEIAHEDRNKLRFRRAAVVAHPDVVGMIRAGKFAGADLGGANLCKLDMSRADLRGANLTDAILTAADLRGANLRGANLTDAILNGANLTDAILTRAILAGANMTDAEMLGARLVGANLNGARLVGANLTDADMFDANLTDAILVGANLTGAILTGANLTDAILNGAVGAQ